MDIELLQSLIAVAESGTVTAAADRVHISQSALSRRLQQIERELDADLLARGRHGVELTELGHQAVAHARTIVGRYADLCRDIAEYQGLQQGTVRVGGGATVTSFLLPEAIAAFQQDHPGIRFFVKEAGSHEVALDVVSGALDVGIVTLPITVADVEVRALLVDEVVLVARSGHPLTRRRVSAADLRRYPFIAFEPGSAIRLIIDARLQRSGVEADVAMELRSIPSILRMVAATDYLAFVSRLSLTPALDVEAVPVRGLTITRRLGLATRSDLPLAPPAQAFVSRLAAPGVSAPGTPAPSGS